MSRVKNKTIGPADVKISAEKDILRLQFSSRFSRVVWGRRQVYKSLGKSDDPQNKKWALAIALTIQADFDYDPELIDPTLEKYLNLNQCDRTEQREILDRRSLGYLWDEFSLYKLNTGIIHQTTYTSRYNRTFRNWIKPWLDMPVDERLADAIATELMRGENYKPNLKKLFSALVEMGERATKLKYLPENYFDNLTDIGKHIKTGKKSQQLSAIQDYRAFSREERDLIIASFYSSENYAERRMAELVEFLFLTGCREGEVFALKWNDIKEDYIIFDESYSSESKLEKSTKTNTVRVFRTTGYTRLLDLLERIKPVHYNQSDHVFLIEGKTMNRHYLNRAWYGKYRNQKFYPGIVKALELDGKLEYLKPSATRHTFISLQVRAGVEIKFLADSVGNSPQVLFKHYLGSNNFSLFND